MIKSITITITLLAVAALSSCSMPLALAPESSRPVVGPEGSSSTQKSWNSMTRQEGEAVLGPLAGTPR